MWRFLIVFSSVILVSVNSYDLIEFVYRTVNTNSGPVRGRLNRTLLQQKDYFALKGIPFAEPPIDELRFKAPEPIDPWSNTFDAFEYGPACPQLEDEINFSETREDCLFLSIFIPGKNEKFNLFDQTTLNANS